jgi:hypothetical protein
MTEELKALLDETKSKFDAKIAGLDATIQTKAQELFDAQKAKNEGEILELNARIDNLVAQAKAKQAESVVVDFSANLKKELAEKYEEVKSVSKGRNFKAEFKDVTIQTNNTLTGAANGAGGAVIVQNGSVILPSPLVNITDIITTVSGTQDTIRIWRETATANTVARVAKAGDKPEQDFSIPPVDFTASYVAGIYIFEKSMMRNLPWMQQRLPEMLRRNFNRFLNAEYFTALASAATAATSSETGIVALVDAIGQLEGDDFPVNGIVLNPKDWAKLSVTRDDENGFTLPGTVVFTNGRLFVNGVPVFKATFVPQGKFIAGDWTQIYNYVTDGLRFELFEQDGDNVRKNAITSRLEQSCVLVIEQPKAFVYGDVFTDAPSV